MKNLNFFSIKNKINFEESLGILKNISFYRCYFICNNKLVFFKNNKFYIIIKNINVLNIKKENIFLLGKNKNTLAIGLSISLKKIKLISNNQIHTLIDLRDSISMTDQIQISHLSALYFIDNWKRNHKFCSKCGFANKFYNLKNYLMCMNKNCLRKIFPKIDPTVIILIKNNNKILLARNKNWKYNLYSCIAGFCEPNESLEGTVYREAYEEVGLKLKNINYLFSQFWPFANNLMVGFEATSNTTKIKVNKLEIDNAIWVSKKELLNLVKEKRIILPKKYAIAYSLIQYWKNTN